jgi:diacylglycerol kinase
MGRSALNLGSSERTARTRLVLGARRLGRSFGYAFAGARYVFETQPNWRIHLYAAGLTIATGLALGVSAAEMAVLALTIGMVLACEAFNTAIEAAVDAATEDRYSLAAKRAKDSAAAAVLVAACTSAAVGLFILGPRLIGVMS